MAASSDYPKKRTRKSLVPKTQRSSPRGFSPRQQVGTSTSNKENTAKEGNDTISRSNEQTIPERKSSAVLNKTIASEEAEAVESDEKGVSTFRNGRTDLGGIKEENLSSINNLLDDSNDQIITRDAGDAVKVWPEQEDKSRLSTTSDTVISDSLKPVVINVEGQLEGVIVDQEQDGDESLDKQIIDSDVEKVEEVSNEGEEEEEAVEVDPEIQKRILNEIAEETVVKGGKIFCYPQVLKADQPCQVFLHRGLSALVNESEIFIKGAFNDWKWKSFSAKLQKTQLPGDWWSCQIHIPKEAYKVDFVFFNGGGVYENNGYKDFYLNVEGMSPSEFDEFLVQEKRREIQRLAEEQAERERLAEEQRRQEEERAGKEADRAQAKIEVEKRRQALHHLLRQGLTSPDNLWYIEPASFKGRDRIKIFYNRNSSPLVHSNEIWIHGGYNKWQDGPSIAERLTSSDRNDGDWWYAEVLVPDRAIVLDWVFADGPPKNAKIYDNNKNQDFHATVPNCISEEIIWADEEEYTYNKLQEERKSKEEAVKRKAEKTALMKAETKARTMKSFLLSQKHIVYTEPLDVVAGRPVTVFYNPSNTLLNGRENIWLRCSFNRWTHPVGLLPPQKMAPSGNNSHVQATVKVPSDAYMMDFVFSDGEDGGIFDNRNGMDYHIPVAGGLQKEPPMHIIHIAVEMAPIAKVGGLGDVVTSLSRAVQDLGHNVEIILPKYDCMNLSNVKDFQFSQSFSWGGTEIKMWFGKVEGLSVYFLEPQNSMFWTGCIYGGRNDAERFGFFCHAALEFLLQRGSTPDILHCHDWSSAPVAWLFKEHYRHYGFGSARVVFTIHNLEFGGNFIGKAMLNADKATTVSNTYAREVSGNPVISPHLYKFHGILNGIDPDIWDPYNDNFIPVPYTAENVVEGKRMAKEALQQRLGLEISDSPLVGIITRLTVQKGIHLIKHAIFHTLEKNGQVVLLGSAPDPRIQGEFVNLANQLHSTHGGRVRLCLTYDEPLSHLIYAGSDFILVPSLFEPCGLTQLTAMRYGSIPIVRKTGGLYDTVFDVDNDKERAQARGLEPNGFNFEGADPAGVDYALNRAFGAWYNGREWFQGLCRRVMEQDWSWNRPALDYLELYLSALK
ncbi:starch synthase 3 isoform X2 [Wolffia australiana]